MPLLKGSKLLEDRWHVVTDDAVLPVDIPIIVTCERLLGEDADYLFHCGCCLGVVLQSHEAVEALVPWVGRLQTIVLRFPKFSDGRAYSSARVLRGRLGYRGELRAIGDVLIDQFAFMRQCGFDAVEIGPDDDADAWLRVAREIGVNYQTDIDHPGTVSALRARHHDTLNRSAA